MDDELVLHEVRRAEVERKLRSVPAEALETGWVREAQIEAVIDAVVAVIYGADDAATAQARHVGEWCARIAAALPYGPDGATARRVGVLADVDPSALERIAELKHVASHVADYQRFVAEGRDGELRVLPLIVAVATEFNTRLAREGRTPGAVLRSMVCEANSVSRSVVEALASAAASRNGIKVCA
jgi:hypothetical protein